MGKDTAADYMVEWFSYMRPDLKVIKQPWAAKLKSICHDLYGHLGLQTMEFYDTPVGRELRNIKLPKIDKTPVEIWIDLGTPAIREQVWDRTWVEYVRNLTADIIICPDTRFQNEIEVCDYTIKVVNPKIPNRAGKSVDDNLNDYKDWDYTIINDLGYSELRGQANSVCYAIEKRI